MGFAALYPSYAYRHTSSIVGRVERSETHRSIQSETALAGDLRLDPIPDHGFDADAVEAVDLLDAGGRGDVDLGEPVADHVDADEDHALLAQCRTDGGADFAVARRQ